MATPRGVNEEREEGAECVSRLKEPIVTDDGPVPKDTVVIIDQLVERGALDDLTFRRMHHLNDSLNGFRGYCQRVTRFRRDSRNRDLHDRLKAMLESLPRRGR
jgi:hypothetical protein